MIITVTLNPSLDLTYTLAEPSLGLVDVHRATSSTVEASGKGVNVSRTLARAGHATVAVLPAGGETGRHLQDLLARERVDHVVVPVQGDTRINTSLLMSSNRTVKVNGPGNELGAADTDRLLERLDVLLAGADHDDGEVWVALCGSMPPGTRPELAREIVELAHRRGARCVADVSGAALVTALEAGADLLAPNGLELGELLGLDLGSTDAAGVARAATDLARASRSALLVSLGEAGAVYADGRCVVRGGGPPLVPVNTAGAGDAFLAGWLAGGGELEARMARGLAFGRSACLSPRTVDSEPATKGLDGITVTTIADRKAEDTTS